MLSEGHDKELSNDREPEPDFNRPMVYQIRVKGQLDSQWTDWFGGLSVTPEEDGDTLLTGPLVDQSALHGLLKKVRNLGIPLLSVNRIEPCPGRSRGAGEANTPDVEP